MTEASAQDLDRRQMHACLARAISWFGANADANDVGGGLDWYWRICTKGLGPIWYVIDTSCLVDGLPTVDRLCATRDEAEAYVARLQYVHEKESLEPFDETYELVVRNHPIDEAQLEWGEPFDIDDEHNMDAATAELRGFG